MICRKEIEVNKMYEMNSSKWTYIFRCFFRLCCMVGSRLASKNSANEKSLTILRAQFDDGIHEPSDPHGQFTAIETNIDDEPVPGTVTQSIGTQKSLSESPMGQVKTVFRKKRIRGGCNHFIHTVEPDGQRTRLGGHCSFCALLAQKLLSRGVIDLDQAEAAPLYCIDCARRCDACGVSGCSKHIHEVGHQDGHAVNWCNECIKKAKRAELRKKVFDLVVAPFTEAVDLPDE